MLIREGGRIKMAQALHSTSHIMCRRIYSHPKDAPKPSQPIEAAVVLPAENR